MAHRVQRSYGHGWEGKADHLPVPAVCECSSHSPLVEVLRLLQDDSGLQMCARRLSFPFSRTFEHFVNFGIFGAHGGFPVQTA